MGIMGSWQDKTKAKLHARSRKGIGWLSAFKKEVYCLLNILFPQVLTSTFFEEEIKA